MTTKTLLLIGTLALASIASAKSYDLVLSAPAKAGTTQLAAGEYSVNTLGNIAVFTNVATGKKFIVGVKAEATASKFDNTAAALTNQNGVNQINSVDLGGSSTTLELQ